MGSGRIFPFYAKNAARPHFSLSVPYRTGSERAGQSVPWSVVVTGPMPL
jgi:hypothetical protein